MTHAVAKASPRGDVPDVVQYALALLAETPDATEPDYAKADRNLERYPLFPLSRNHNVTRLGFEDERGRFWWVTNGGAKLPGPFANRLWLAIETLWNRHGPTPPADRIIRTTFSALADILNLERGGRTWALLRSTLKAIRRVQVEQFALFRVGADQYLSEREFNLLYDVTFTRKAGSKTAEVHVEIELSRVVAANLSEAQPMWRLVDMNIINALHGDVAQRLYRYLAQARWFGTVPQPVLRLPLLDLRRYLPLEQESPSHIMRVLAPAHEELIEKGVLRGAALIKNGRGADQQAILYTFGIVMRVDDGDAIDVSTLQEVQVVPAPLPALPATASGADGDAASRWRRLMLVSSGDDASDAFFRKCALHLTDEHVNTVVSDIEADLRSDRPMALDVRRKTLVRRLRDRLTANGVA